MTTPSTCCRKSSEQGCAWYIPSNSMAVATTNHFHSAKEAKCSCGQQSALSCTCEKFATENTVSGPRCSCRARPAQKCTCHRKGVENTTPTGSTCACGSRPADACTCEKAADRGSLPTETDFTTI
ncbi:hypothetical protein BJ878DRAFT_43901 [Calycina marina]|uniref:DUF7871 domain-containing protein n=1 Tax=Calycina marina TaxID=1763456 RepID=A0A9P8CF89_9HELO|nr:hypothetical protein BJ878DRAFT_43901 [Calycina marina]